MKKEEQKMAAAYEAPQVEIIEVQVEKGFAGSFTTTSYTNEEW